MLASDPTAEADVLLYFRNLYDVAISLIQHRARTNRWIFHSHRDAEVVARSNPSQQIAVFEEVFGESNVRVGVFDAALRGPGLERHFMELAGIEWFDGLVEVGARNVSMDLISTAFLNMLSCEYGLDRSVWRVAAAAMPESFAFPTLRTEMEDGVRGVVSTIDVSHPKLQHARALLTEDTHALADSRPELTAFLDSFEAMLREVRSSLETPSRRTRTTAD